jgi:hypothetical protein
MAMCMRIVEGLRAEHIDVVADTKIWVVLFAFLVHAETGIADVSMEVGRVETHRIERCCF